MPRPNPSSPLPHLFRPLGYIYPLAQAWLKQSCLLSGPHSEASATFLSLIVSPPTNFPPPFYFRSVIWRRSCVPLFSYLFFKLSDLFAQFSTSAAQWNEKPVPAHCRMTWQVVTLAHVDGKTGITQGYTSTPGRGNELCKIFQMIAVVRSDWNPVSQSAMHYWRWSRGPGDAWQL